MWSDNEPVPSVLAQTRPQLSGAEGVAAWFPTQFVAGADGASSKEAAHAGTCRRRKLWQIAPGYHCAIVGTCLPMAELRRIARRAGLEQWRRASDYELHHAAVNSTCHRNALSQLVQKELETRFALATRRFAQARTDDDVLALWNDAVGCGEIAGALWAVMSHPHATEGLQQSVSQEIHMLSHQAGAASRADLRRLAELERETQNLRQALERQREKSDEKLADKERAIAALEPRACATAALERRLLQAEERLRFLGQGEALTEACERAAAQTLRAQRAEERADRCERKLAQEAERIRQLERMLEQATSERQRETQAATGCCCREDDEEAGSSEPDLSGRRVLCVGGRSGLIDQYRALVEQRHGRFLHHDGGLEDNFARLQSLLASADAVVCAARYINHGAYYVVKRFCKRHCKPCILLRNDGASSFVRGIRALAGTSSEAGQGDTVLVASGLRTASSPQ